uniref:uncharacterized protein LOC120344539 n=1 Tax=Styela clava TaxID=7725 RepID=UPI00193A20D8|nr:uncharacterized protein LOC120344539 [Styela clava]
MSSSFIDDSLRRNPWAKETSHPYDEVLALFQKSQKHEMLPENEIIAQSNETKLSQGMDLIAQANEARRKLGQIRAKCTFLNLENRTSDILRSEELKSNLIKVEKVLNGFETCVTEVQWLQETLMQTYKGESIKLERKYHESFQELFTNSVNVLHHLQNELDTLQWHKDNSVDNVEHRNILKTLSDSVTNIEAGMKTIETMHLNYASCI